MNEVQQEARYLDRSCFYAVVPLAPQAKAPRHKDWPKRSFDVGDFKPGDNIGVKLGEPSGGLVDVDLDDPIALGLADKYLPPTEAVTGRPSAPRSHWWYRCPGAKTRKWKLPEHGMIVELRSTGNQTVVGPSIHPSGERYEKLRGEPAEIEPDTLVPAIEKLYEAVAKHYGVEPATKPDPAPRSALECPPNQPLACYAPLVGQWEEDEKERRAIAYIDHYPPAISRQHGHGTTFELTQALLRGFLLPDDTVFRLLRDHYNPRCQPPWTEKELWHKIESAHEHPCDKQPGWLLNDCDPKALASARESAENLLGEARKKTEARATIEQQEAPGEIHFPAWTAAELAAMEGLEPDYLVDGLLVAGQPCIVAGPQKSLKTSILLDLGISLATGGYFLGKFKAARPVGVVIMTGESGLATIKETILRISKAAGVNPRALDKLIISDRLPRIEDPKHLRALASFLGEHKPVVSVFDPAYMALDGTDPGNLFRQGKALRGITEVCAAHGIAPILAHHTRKNVAEPHALPVMESIAWSGFAEWARQWLLIGRREPYLPGSGEHRLWLVAGGSAGHSGAWGLDVSEGSREDEGGRIWQTTVQPADEIQDQRRRTEAGRKALLERQARDDRCKRVWEWLSKRDNATKRAIRDALCLNNRVATETIDQLFENGSIEAIETVAGNGQKCTAYRVVRDPPNDDD